MGAWGEGNFDNDDASDWLLELEKSKGLDFLLSPIKAALSATDYLEAPNCSETLAAAEVIAASISGDHTSIPEGAQAWLSKKHGLFRCSVKIEREHAVLASKAISKILGASELKELWQETPSYSNWRQHQQALIARLVSA
jgi:hypothetical protein